jgi:hypothetical protein
VLTHSFYGAENPRLTDELLPEAPGISIGRWKVSTDSSSAGICVIPPPGKKRCSSLRICPRRFLPSFAIAARSTPKCQRPVDAVWAAWKLWCEANNQPVGTKAMLGRDLRAAVPTLKRERPTPGGRGTGRREARIRLFRAWIAVKATVARTWDHQDQMDELRTQFGVWSWSGPRTRAL